MAKAKSSRKHAELFTPTMTSRALTWTLLIILPILGYLLGLRIQEVQDNVRISELQSALTVPSQTTATPSAQ